MARTFLQWEPIERRRRGCQYLTWLRDGKQVLYKELKDIDLPEDMAAHHHNLSSKLDEMRKSASQYSWRKREWAKADDDQTSLFKVAMKTILNDVHLFIEEYGGREKWEVSNSGLHRSYGDPNVPFAYLTVSLKHTDPETPFELKVSFGMHAQKKRVKITKTKYNFADDNIQSGHGSPFVNPLPLGGLVKIVMDGAAKDSAQLSMAADCNGNAPRFWDIVCTVVDILKGSHYRYFCKTNDTCRGQFSDMALKTLCELNGIEKHSVSSSPEKMSLGDKMTIRFLDIPDLFEENPEDAMSDDEDEEDDDE